MKQKQIIKSLFREYYYIFFSREIAYIPDDPEVTANIYCKSRNLPNTDTQNYSTDLR